jgi:colicin import membrane protein
MTELEHRSDRWVSATMSVLLHAALIGALVYGWWSFRHASSKPEPTLAIDATIVSSKALNGGGAAKHTPPPARVAATQPPPPPPVEDDQTTPEPPPAAPPKATETAAEEQARAAAAQALEADQRKAREKVERDKQAAAEREQAQERQAKAQAERKAQAAAEAKERAAQAERDRLAEAKRKADEARKAEEARRAAEAQELAANQADIQQSVADEERSLAATSGPAMASWKQLIEARIHQAWIQPPTVRSGLDCTLTVTQVPGGQIVNVKLGSCNGDSAVQQSIEDAAYRASPLPPPPDPALFVRELTIHFTHSDNSP